MRDRCLNYLLHSGFIENYVKKLLFPSDINDLYEDYVQEVWLAICEVPEEKWDGLYNRRPNQDEFYDVRNFVSRIISNTVRSVTSAAYRKLKKQYTVADRKTDEEWKYMANTIPDETSIFEKIKNNQ